MKTPCILLLLSIMILLATQSALAGASQLCEKSEHADNYDSKFLQNFVTLKQGQDGWLFRDYDLKQKFGPSNSGYQQLAKLNKSLSRQGTTLVLVPVPTRGITHPEKLGNIDYDVDKARVAYSNYIESLKRIGIVVPDLDQLYTRKHTRPLFFARDHHWTERGSKEVAKLTSRTLKSLDSYPDLEKVKFETFRTGNKYNRGSLSKASKILCNSKYPDEKFYLFHTQPSDEVDLFAQPSPPQVVLVGTSNSNGQLNFNFDGYLRQFAQVDILNLAESGSGYGGSLKSYLSSSDFKQSPAKIIIWEVPGYYSLNSNDYFNQLIRMLGETS